MKKCPFCAEEIQDEAVKCKHCGEFLNQEAGAQARRFSVDPKKSKSPWYYSTTSIVIGFFCVGPLVLPLIWSNPKYNRTTKIVVSVIVIGVSWYLFKLTIVSLGHLKDYFNVLQGMY